MTLADPGQLNTQIAQFVTASNDLKDVNASGALSFADVGLTSAELTKAPPAP